MQNFVYADEEGNIGFYAAGLVPIRKRGDGTVPVPGSTDDYDWTGFIPFKDLPHAYNPPRGMIATANGRIVPDDYPYLITRKWDAPYRTARIFELLRRGSSFVPSDMLRIQTDIDALDDQWLARQLLSAATHCAAEGPDAEYALSVLKGWDGQARADSAATLVCEVTRRTLLERILKPKLGDDLSGYHWPMSTVFLQNVLEQNLTRWLPPGDADFNLTLMKSLEDGVKRIPSLVHSRSHSAWRWGDTIPLTFHHPLSAGLPLLGRLLDVGPFTQSGTGTTVKQTTPRLGPSMRMVVDFSDFDQSMQNITLGESGEVSSPYYQDQFQAWYTGRSFPMLFSDRGVEKGTLHKLVLKPGK
jgi:penicillin G amidase